MTVNVGSFAPATGGVINNIQSPVTVIGDGNATLNVDDTGSTAYNVGALAGTLTNSSLAGLGMAGIDYSGLAALNISLGGGTPVSGTNPFSNVITVLSTSSGTVTTLNLGHGANVVNVGSQAPPSLGVVNNIQGALIVDGNNNDTLNIDDSGNGFTNTGTLTGTTLTGLGMGSAGITYNALSALNIYLTSASNLTTQSTNVSTVTTVVTV